MNTLIELYNEIYLHDLKLDSQAFVEFVESKIDSSKLLDLSGSEDEYQLTRLISDYAISLYNTGTLKKSLSFLDKAIYLFDNNPLSKIENLFDSPLYEALVWTRGLTNHKLRNFRSAKLDFNRLADNFPDKLDYRNGYNTCTNYWLIRVQWITLGLLASATILDIFLKNKNTTTNSILLIVLIFGLISSLSLEFIIKRRRFKL